MLSYHSSVHEAIVATIRELGAPRHVAQAIARAYPRGRGVATAPPRLLAAAGGHEGPKLPPWARRISAAFVLANAVMATQAADAEIARAEPIRAPDIAAAQVRRMLAGQTQELFLAIYLSARQAPIDAVIVHRGSLSNVPVHPREVFRPAVQAGAHSVLVAHNHPSGICEPSDSDIELTSRLVEVGRLVGVPLVDHLIVTDRSVCSLAARGLV